MKKVFSVLFLLVGMLALAVPSGAAPSISAGQLRKALEAHPEVLLDFLRENSETLLEIVQEGAVSRRNKAIIAGWEKDLKAPVKTFALKDRLAKGPDTAPVTIVAYSDFTCPYCFKGEETLRKLLEQYPGKVRYVFKPYPLEDKGIGRLAAAYFVAAGLQNPNKAWRFYDRLFYGHNRLLQEGENAIRQMASKSGLDMKRLAEDIKSARVAEILDSDYEEGTSLGVEGTPTYFVNNLLVRGAVTDDLFAKAIDMALKAKNS